MQTEFTKNSQLITQPQWLFQQDTARTEMNNIIAHNSHFCSSSSKSLSSFPVALFSEAVCTRYNRVSHFTPTTLIQQNMSLSKIFPLLKIVHELYKLPVNSHQLV